MHDIISICLTAISDHSVEKKKREPEKESVRDEPAKKKSKPTPVSSGPREIPNYKTMSGSSNVRFGILTKIVQHMKARHQDGDDHPLTLDEVLDETALLDVGSRVR